MSRRAQHTGSDLPDLLCDLVWWTEVRDRLIIDGTTDDGVLLDAASLLQRLVSLAISSPSLPVAAALRAAEEDE